MFTDIERHILLKMIDHGYIGGRHTAVEELPKGLPSHMKGEAVKAVKQLVKQGWLIPKITSYGLHVSIDPTKIPEIEKLLKEI